MCKSSSVDIFFEFIRAPESFPPDTFNSGFMVFTPSAATFAELLRLNDEIGSTEGGDQGVFNNAYCPNWFSTYTDDPRCGRLPWIFNTEVIMTFCFICTCITTVTYVGCVL